MTGALDDFRRALEAAKPQPISLPLVRNLDGEVTHDVNSLVEQLVVPVQFVASLQRLETLGVDTLVILGPGLVLCGLVRRTLGTRLRVFTTEDAADLQRTIAATRSAP
jgi:[acyl-carrier-protein] S-malonyltransferase